MLQFRTREVSMNTHTKQFSLGLQRGYRQNDIDENWNWNSRVHLGRMFGGSVTSLACTNWKIYERGGSLASILLLYHRERILETSTLSCNKEEEEITKPPKR